MNQGAGMRLAFLSSLIRTVTVGFGFSPNLLTSSQNTRSARGLSGLWPEYRRWGFSPRPENKLIIFAETTEKGTQQAIYFKARSRKGEPTSQITNDKPLT